MVNEKFDLMLLDIKNKITTSSEFKDLLSSKHKLFNLMNKLSDKYDINSDILWEFVTTQVSEAITWDGSYTSEEVKEVKEVKEKVVEVKEVEVKPIEKPIEEVKENNPVETVKNEETKLKLDEAQKEGKSYPSLSEQRAHKEIALTAPTLEAKIEALNKMTHFKTMYELWEESSDKKLKLYMLRKENREEKKNKILKNALIESALKDNDRDYRLESIKYLHNQMMIKEIAELDGDKKVRRAAVKRVQDQTTLQNIAYRNTDDEMRVNAIKNINDSKFIVKKLLGEDDLPRRIRSAAEKRMFELQEVEEKKKKRAEKEKKKKEKKKKEKEYLLKGDVLKIGNEILGKVCAKETVAVFNAN